MPTKGKRRQARMVTAVHNVGEGRWSATLECEHVLWLDRATKPRARVMTCPHCTAEGRDIRPRGAGVRLVTTGAGVRWRA